MYLLYQAQPVINRYGNKPARDFENVEADFIAFLDVVVHNFGPVSEDTLDKSSCRDQYIVIMGEVDDFSEGIDGHEYERTPCEFQGVHILTHRLQNILEVAYPHRGIVGATDLGNTAGTEFLPARVSRNE